MILPRQPTPAELARARERYRDGVPKKTIAKSLGVSLKVIIKLVADIERPESGYGSTRGRKNGLRRALSRYTKSPEGLPDAC